jgi:C1A family cysteine protease
MQKLLFALGAVALLAMTHVVLYSQPTLNETENSQYGNLVNDEWKAWKVEHGKVYNTIEEETHRFGVWIQNKKYIDENQGEEYTLGLNHFSDLTNEEWKAIYLMNKSIIKDFHTEETSSENHIPKDFAAPTTVNWVSQGKTISVLNQGQCGSCWAFSTVESIDSAFAVTKGGAVPNLSEQQVVSCSGSYGEYGCNGGNVVPAYKYVQAHPLATNAQYPYVSGNSKATGTCDKTKESQGTYKITGYKTIPSNNCDALQNALATTPIAVCVDASTWQNYKSGVFSNCGTSLDHCVLAVGYVQGSYWNVQNSWTTGWGMGGFIQLKWGNTCGVCKEAQYPTV